MNVEDVFFTIARDIKTRLAETDSKPDVGLFFSLTNRLGIFYQFVADYCQFALAVMLLPLFFPADTSNFEVCKQDAYLIGSMIVFVFCRLLRMPSQMSSLHLAGMLNKSQLLALAARRSDIC